MPTFGASGATATGTTSVAVAYPTGVASGHMLTMAVATRPSTAVVNTPAGWTLLGSFSGGAGTYGAGTGPAQINVFILEATSALSGSVTVSITNGNSSWGQMKRWTKTTGSNIWDIGITGGADTVVGTAWSALYGTVAAGFVAVGDILQIYTAQAQATSATWASEAITAQGGGTITLGTATADTAPSTTTGNDIGGRIVRYTPSASSQAAGTLTHTATLSGTTTNVSGPSALVRIREIAPTLKSASDTLSVNVSETTNIVPTTPPDYVESVPIGKVADNLTWFNLSGGSALVGDINEGYDSTDTTDGIKPDWNILGPALDTITFSITPTSWGKPVMPPTIRIYYSAVNEPGGQASVAFMQGTTVIASRNIPNTGTGGVPTAIEFSLTQAETDAVTLWSNTLRLRFNYNMTATSIPAEPIRIYNASMRFWNIKTQEDLVPDSTISQNNFSNDNDFSTASHTYIDEGWLNTGNDGAVTTGTLSGAGTAEAIFGISNPTITPGTTPAQIGIRHYSTLGVATGQVILLQGTTPIATVNLPNTGGISADVTYTLTSAEHAAITDWTNLRFRVLHTQPSNTTNAVRVENATLRIFTSDSASTDTPITASDNLSASVDDIADILVKLSASDTLSANVADVGSFSTVAVVASDTLSASVTEGRSFGTVAVVGTETLSASVTESVTTKATVTASDTLSASVTDVGTFATVNVTANDTLSVSVTETATFANVAVAANDTLSVNVSEGIFFATVTLSTTDTLAAAVNEGISFGTVSASASDTLTASVTDTGAIAPIAIVASDTLSASVTEGRSFGTVSVVASDTLSVTVTDAAVLFAPLPASDSLAVNLSELSSLDISGLVIKSASDTLTASLIEVDTESTVFSSSDSLDVTLTESTSLQISGLVVMSASDQLVAGLIGENTSFGTVGLSTTDILNATVTENRFFAPVTLTTSDSLNAAVAESYVFTTLPFVASDTLTVAMTDAGVFSPIAVTVSDTLSASLTENAMARQDFPAADFATVLLSESSSIEISGLVLKSASDTLTASVSESFNFGTVLVGGTGTFFGDDFNRADSGTIGVTDWRQYLGGIAISNGTAKLGNGAVNYDIFKTPTLSDDQYVQLQIDNLGTAPSIGVLLRSGPTYGTSDATSGAFYLVRVTGTGIAIFSHAANGALVTQTSINVGTVNPGDVLRGEVIGNTVYGYINGVLKTQWTDPAPITGQNYTGMRMSGSAATAVDNFAAGDLGSTGNDSLRAAVTESIDFATVSVSASDSLNAQEAETTNFAIVAVSASDTLAVAVDESISFGSVSVSTSDNLNAALSESRVVFASAPGFDSLIVTLTETSQLLASGTSFIPASDSLRVSVTEQAAITCVAISAQDTLIAGSIDVVNTQFVTLATSDTVSAAVSETTSFSTVSVVASDNLLASVTDSAVIQSDLPGSDTLAATITETADIVKSGTLTITASDTLTAVVIDSSALATNISADDTLCVNVLDTSALDIQGLYSTSASDQLCAVVTETSEFNSIGISGTNNLRASVSEQVAIFVSVSASDTLRAGVSESIAFAPQPLSSTDTLSASVTESRVAVTVLPGLDTLFVQLSETTSIQVSGVVSKVASDTLGVHVTEQLTFNPVVVQGFDNLIAQTFENISFGTVAVTASDSLTAQIVDVTANRIIIDAHDIVGVRVFETSSIVKFGQIEISASDELLVALEEASQKIDTEIVQSEDILMVAVEETGTVARQNSRVVRPSDWIISIHRKTKYPRPGETWYE